MLTAFLCAGSLGVGIILGGLSVRASMDRLVREARVDRDLALRAESRAIRAGLRLTAEVEHWKSIAASPVSALVAAARSARA